jgi:hypothetical protein
MSLVRRRVDDDEVDLAAATPTGDVERQAGDAAVLHHHVVAVASLRPIERRPLPIVGIKDHDGGSFSGRLDGEASGEGGLGLPPSAQLQPRPAYKLH